MVHAQDLAVLMGLCASMHLDVVLSVLKRLEIQLTDPAFPCNEGSRSDFTCALILCYGQVALKAPAEDLLQRMDTDFMERLRHHVTTKEPSVRLSLCRSVGMMAQAVRSASPSGAPSFPAKAKLLATMMALDLLQFFGSSYTLDDSLKESLREGILYLAAQDLRQTIQSLVTLTSPSESSLPEVWQVLSTSQVVSETVKDLADHLGLMREMKVDDPELDIHRHTEEQLAAQSSALTEQETPAEPVVLRALLGLITVLSIADKSQAKALVPFVYCRARPCLESESPEVRRVTVVLLGQLVRLGSEKARLNKEVHSSLVSVLLNLTDPSPEVIQACWTVLQHFTLECVLSMKEMCRILITSGQFSLAQRLALQGAQSRRAWVRESAAIFIGLQVQQLQRRLCSCFALRRAQRALRILLQDPEPQVRERAAEAMGLFTRP
ncbi:maestro heat-like repeat-containing protein family member 1 isoform X2 [Lepisosteus oculatus]|uniref:maestro heat-like repeat-containing protein family member 1 isoform X2 n=1 Tax=Lepisosteus oculatus TaxID=7918 RepID=UPI0037172083